MIVSLDECVKLVTSRQRYESKESQEMSRMSVYGFYTSGNKGSFAARISTTCVCGDDFAGRGSGWWLLEITAWNDPEVSELQHLGCAFDD